MERDAFLRTVAAAVAARAVAEETPYVPGPLVAGGPEHDLAELFTVRLAGIDGNAHRLMPGEHPGEVVAGIVAGYGATSFLAWDDEHLPLDGVTAALAGNGLQRLAAAVPAEAAERIAHQMGYFDLIAGVTGAAAGFAESGSIVLAAGPGKPRMASLIPLVHVALLRTADLWPSLSHWAAAHPEAARDTANLVFVTGPSRTGDIEMQLNLGVHGPKYLHVVLVD